MSTFTRKKHVHIAGTIGLTLGALLVVSNPASAHMGIDSLGQTYTAGKGATVYLRPGHGCNATGDSTNSITVTVTAASISDSHAPWRTSSPISSSRPAPK